MIYINIKIYQLILMQNNKINFFIYLSSILSIKLIYDIKILIDSKNLLFNTKIYKELIYLKKVIFIYIIFTFIFFINNKKKYLLNNIKKIIYTNKNINYATILDLKNINNINAIDDHNDNKILYKYTYDMKYDINTEKITMCFSPISKQELIKEFYKREVLEELLNRNNSKILLEPKLLFLNNYFIKEYIDFLSNYINNNSINEILNNNKLDKMFNTFIIRFKTIIRNRKDKNINEEDLGSFRLFKENNQNREYLYEMNSKIIDKYSLEEQEEQILKEISNYEKFLLQNKNNPVKKKKIIKILLDYFKIWLKKTNNYKKPNIRPLIIFINDNNIKFEEINRLSNKYIKVFNKKTLDVNNYSIKFNKNNLFNKKLFNHYNKNNILITLNITEEILLDNSILNNLRIFNKLPRNIGYCKIEKIFLYFFLLNKTTLNIFLNNYDHIFFFNQLLLKYANEKEQYNFTLNKHNITYNEFNNMILNFDIEYYKKLLRKKLFSLNNNVAQIYNDDDDNVNDKKKPFINNHTKEPTNNINNNNKITHLNVKEYIKTDYDDDQDNENAFVDQCPSEFQQYVDYDYHNDMMNSLSSSQMLQMKIKDNQFKKAKEDEKKMGINIEVNEEEENERYKILTKRIIKNASKKYEYESYM